MNPNGTQAPNSLDVRLPGKGNPNSHGARSVHLIITMIKWIRTSRLSIKNSRLPPPATPREGYLEKGIQTPMAQGRSTKIITMIKWIRTGRLSIKNLWRGRGEQRLATAFQLQGSEMDPTSQKLTGDGAVSRLSNRP